MANQPPRPLAGGAPAGVRPPVQPRPSRTHSPAAAAPRGRCPCCGAGAAGSDWLVAVPRRVYFALTLVSAPFRAAVWVLDGLVAAATVGVIAVVWLWWHGTISDAQVASFLAGIGSRGLDVLHRSGMF